MVHHISFYRYVACCSLVCVSISIVAFYHYSTVQTQLKPYTMQHSTTIYPYIGLIIDDRATPRVVTVVLNVLEHIPSDWKIQIFTLQQHWSFYQKSSLEPFIQSNRVFLTSIDFPRNNRSGSDFINLYLTSPSLWRRVQGEKVLLFQIDSAICSNSSYKLTDFLHYDYIGAPWKVGGCCNGGFSIRSRTKTLLLLESEHGRYPLHQINEDGWFATNLPRFGGTVASISVAKTFAVETIYSSRPFAVHNPSIDYLGREDMKRICTDCPEVRNITDDCSKL